MIRALAHSVRRGVGRACAEFSTERIFQARSDLNRVQDSSVSLRGAYYFTSEKGVFRIDITGIYRVLDVACYGIAMGGPWVFLALYCFDYAIVVRGDRWALREPGRRFRFTEIYRLKTLSSNERIHSIFLGDEALWVANTGRNTLLKVDPEEARVIAEIPIILDRFGRPVLYNNNHINSVSEYGGVVVFVAYRAGTQSMIGVLDGTRVTGYGYPRVGVHDIFLTDGGFLICDTFGAGTEAAGGVPVTEKGPMDPEFFSRPPGCIVRGIAGTGEETLIGHSHKGERALRFSGNGAILVAQNGQVVNRIDVPPAQIYQIITEEGEFVARPSAAVDAAKIRSTFQQAFGEPICEATIADYPREGQPLLRR